MEQGSRRSEQLDGRLDNVTLEIYRLYLGEAHTESELKRGLNLTWQDN